LGLATFITKFGLKAAGWVAVSGTTLQTMIRSCHTIVGMLLLMTSVIVLLRAYRVCRVWNDRHQECVPQIPNLNTMSMEGGLR